MRLLNKLLLLFIIVLMSFYIMEVHAAGGKKKKEGRFGSDILKIMRNKLKICTPKQMNKYEQFLVLDTNLFNTQPGGKPFVKAMVDKRNYEGKQDQSWHNIRFIRNFIPQLESVIGKGTGFQACSIMSGIKIGATSRVEPVRKTSYFEI